MKYLIKKVGQYLHNYAVVPDNASHEDKEETYFKLFGIKEYVEIDESEMYHFGVLKSEGEDYKNSSEYRGEFEDKFIFNVKGLTY